MGTEEKQRPIENGIGLKAAIRRRWKKRLVSAENTKYAHEIEENLADEAVEEVHSRADKCSTCREKGRHYLHSKHVLRTIVALCIIDCIMVMVELLLDNAAVRHDIVDKYGLRGGGCSDETQNGTIHNRHRRAAGGGDGADHGAHSAYANIAHYCHYVSIAILCLLAAETLVKIFCFGRKFLDSKLEVFDAFIVLGSLIADCILLDGVTSNPPLLSSAIVNLLLPWRIIRVVNSLVIATRDHEHFKLLLVYKAKKQVEDQLDLTTAELQQSRLHSKKLLETMKNADLDTKGLEYNSGHKTVSDKSLELNDDVKVTLHPSDVSYSTDDNGKSDAPVTHL